MICRPWEHLLLSPLLAFKSTWLHCGGGVSAVGAGREHTLLEGAYSRVRALTLQVGHAESELKLDMRCWCCLSMPHVCLDCSCFFCTCSAAAPLVDALQVLMSTTLPFMLLCLSACPAQQPCAALMSVSPRQYRCQRWPDKQCCLAA